MDIIARVLSPWVGDGTPISNPFRPQFRDDFPVITWSDVTGTDTARLIPPINAVVLEIQTDDTTFSAIESAGYQIIWWEPTPDHISQ